MSLDKKICLHTLIFLLIFISPNLFAQHTGLIGSWRIDLNKAIELMEEPHKSQFDSLSEEVKTRAFNSMRDREFTFEENGNFTGRWKSREADKISTGTWSVAGEYLTLVVDNQSIEYEVTFDSFGNLVLKGLEKNGFFYNLYFIKK